MNNERNNYVKRKTFVALLIMELFIIMGILLILIHNSVGNETVLRVSILLVMGNILCIFAKTLIEIAYKSQYSAIESKEYVSKNLYNDYCVEVIPIKDEKMHEKFLTEELTKRAKFYAQIMNDETVMISVMFNNENERVFYGGLNASDFKEYFKIKEEQV